MYAIQCLDPLKNPRFSIQIPFAGTVACYYEYFAQENVYITYKIPELNVTNTLQTQGGNTKKATLNLKHI